jgi:transposase
MADEIEKAGHIPILANAARARAMMGQVNKTDKLDAKGLATLLRNGTLPSVWIPSGKLRDERELTRMRMALIRMRTMIKNRIHATLSRYAINIDEVSDIFGPKGRKIIEDRSRELPPYTQKCLCKELELLNEVEDKISQIEVQIKAVMIETEEIKLLRTIPGIGLILAVVISTEIGDINRFSGPEKLASYSGTVPRVKASGGKVFYGPIRPDVNHYLKRAFIEAANTVVIFHKKWSNRYVAKLYGILRAKKGNSKSVVAVARHLAEATYWVLKKREPYKEKDVKNPVSSTRK